MQNSGSVFGNNDQYSGGHVEITMYAWPNQTHGAAFAILDIFIFSFLAFVMYTLAHESQQQGF